MAATLCPYCSQPAITYAQKLFLGPLRTLSCRNCHRAVTVSIASVGPGIGLMLALTVLACVMPGSFRIWLLLAALALVPVVAWHQVNKVPLVAPHFKDR